MPSTGSINSAEDLRAPFVPLIVSCDGAVGKEYANFIKRTDDKLSLKWNRSYSKILEWLRVRVEISIIHAISTRVRGTRRRVRGVGCEDGAGMFGVDF